MGDTKLTEENYYDKAYNELAMRDALFYEEYGEGRNDVICDIVLKYMMETYKWSTYQQLYEQIRDINYSELLTIVNGAFEKYRYILLMKKVTALNDIATYLADLSDSADSALKRIEEELDNIETAIRYLQ